MAVAVAERVDGLEEGYKRKEKHCPWVSQRENHELWQQRKRRRKQRGGILSAFLIPAVIAAAEAAAAEAISAGAGYGTRKAHEEATRNKRVGKISAGQ